MNMASNLPPFNGSTAGSEPIGETFFQNRSWPNIALLCNYIALDLAILYINFRERPPFLWYLILHLLIYAFWVLGEYLQYLLEI